MKKYIIDTNALISFVTDRNTIQQGKIAVLFEDAAQLKAQIVCPQNVFTEFVYVMDTVYHVSKKHINSIMRDFIDTPGIELVHDVDMSTLLNIWPDKIGNYGDAIIAVTSKNILGSIVVTFDSKFRTSLKKLGISVISL